ncbi:MAG: hypothetical protein RLZZ293_533 [Pseudomonadota bacterium]|jgi:UDP-N-acetylmuramyl pentapeptide phosphotransferase/UDP-N-acetylglucosamine-1-phosphate transferase
MNLIWLMLSAGVIAYLICWIIIRTYSWHRYLTADEQFSGLQKFHKISTPRIAGLAIFISAWLLASYGLISKLLWAKFFIKLLLPTSMVFLVGFAEDLIKEIKPFHRLFLVILACIVGIYAVQIINLVTHTNVNLLDYLLRFQLISVIVTIFILLGATNAFNIIDGYNGLCLTTFSTILITCLLIAYQVNYHYLDQTIIILLGAVLGVILWNYPNGKIFLGDGGAYLLGFIATLILLELSQKITNYSPFTSLLIMIYPISETLLSIYRKKFLRGRSPFKPDRLHFHMIVYSRLIKHEVNNRNAAVVIKMLWLIFPQLVVAFFSYKQQSMIILAIIIYLTMYFWIYFRIIQFKTPKFIKFN